MRPVWAILVILGSVAALTFLFLAYAFRDLVEGKAAAISTRALEAIATDATVYNPLYWLLLLALVAWLFWLFRGWLFRHA